MPAPGGYCTSPCGLTGSACDGTCVATARAGELCMKSCTADAECRTDEGYLCDLQWKACIVPNSAALVPKQCPASTQPRDRAFAPSTLLSTAASPGLYQFEPTAALTATGALFTLFITRSSIREPNMLGSARVGGGAPTVIDGVFTTTIGNRFDPWLARDAKGTLYAVWLDFEAPSKNQQILLSRSTDAGTTWSVPSPVHAQGDCPDGEADCLDKPMVLVGPAPGAKGKQIVYVMYSAADGLRVRASRDGGASFSAPVTALEGIYGNAAIGTDGRLHLVTLNGGPTTGAFGSASHRVEYVVSADGGRSFTSPQTVSGRDEMLPFFFSNPSIATDSKRKWLYVVYTRGGRDAVWDLVVLASKDAGKTWKRTRIGDAPSCAIHMVPNIALDPTTGTLHVAWYDNRGDKGRFAHATCSVGAAKCTEAGPINDVPFAALSTERHGPTWIGEYEALVIDARRRTLHAVWSQPIDESGKIVSRIFHAAAKLPKR
jgi:hypothetical protein